MEGRCEWGHTAAGADGDRQPDLRPRWYALEFYRRHRGDLADKTKQYWTLVILGYTIQVLAIPALALVPENGWLLACTFVVIERVGKAIKKPAKNTLVSFASSEIGQGKGFAYQEFLDQLGAFMGPVILFVISLIKGTDNLMNTYRYCFLF